MKKNNNKSKTLLNKIIIFFLCFVLLTGITGFFMLGHVIGKLSKSDRNPEDKIQNVEPTTLYDKDGKKFYEYGAEQREIVTYDQLPQVTIDAFLAIEDSRFFSHNGFDLPRFISSAIHNLKTKTLGQGGSTLTMQAIDNFIIKDKEKLAAENGHQISALEKIELKIQEIYLSLRLDSKMSKKDIFINYLNKINFGSSARGIQKGSQYYFGKNVEELNLSESAFLAGVVNAPYYYNPYFGYNKEKNVNFYKYAMERRNETLAQMLNHGYISKKEYNLAKSTKLAFQVVGESSTDDNPYLAYAQAVLREAAKVTGDNPANVPMKIYTSLDRGTQERITDIESKKVFEFPNNPYLQVATSVIDNKTGAIIAIGAGFNDATNKPYQDRAMINTHQIGSTSKPFIAYAPAFDNLGWATSRIMNDRPYKVYGDVKTNYDMKYHGKIPLEHAIAQSYNIPAFETTELLVNKVGNQFMVDYMKKLGFDASVAENFDLLYAIGGGDFVATPTQVAAAYSAFANNGVYTEPYMIHKIEYKDKSSTYTHHPKKTKAMSPQAAYMTADLLKKSVTGKYSAYNMLSSAFSGASYPVYGKTGTTDWSDENLIRQAGGNMKDEWMVNFTKDHTVCSWYGFDGLVPGYSYISTSILNMNLCGKINRYLLDPLSANAQVIPNPGGVSSYGGGLIKTSDLPNAHKNNPETVENVRSASDDLKKLLSSINSYKKDDYTPETWNSLQSVIEEINKLLKEENISDNDFNKIKDKFNNAINNLKKAEPKVDTSALYSAIELSQPYWEPSKYNPEYVKKLYDAVNAANELLTKDKISQSEIDQAIAAINKAVEECKSHPINTSEDTD